MAESDIAQRVAAGDYSVFPAITREDAEAAVTAAEGFVAEVEKFLQAQGFTTRE